MKEIAETRVALRLRRVHVLLKREGWCVNHKRNLQALQGDGPAAAQQDAERL